jgi:hypothetical protein
MSQSQIHVTDHAVERARERLDHLYQDETSGGVPVVCWLKYRAAMALSRFGGIYPHKGEFAIKHNGVHFLFVKKAGDVFLKTVLNKDMRLTRKRVSTEGKHS